MTKVPDFHDPPPMEMADALRQYLNEKCVTADYFFLHRRNCYGYKVRGVKDEMWDRVVFPALADIAHKHGWVAMHELLDYYREIYFRT